MRKTIIILLLLTTVPIAWADKRDAEKQMDRFVSALMKKMTLEEKIGQLNLGAAGDPKVMNSPIGLDEAIKRGLISSAGGASHDVQRIAVEESRLGIPLLFGLDVIHGYATTFPIPLAQASSWNMSFIERGAQIAAKEATARGISWTWSPMLDICRDPRWGRVAEGAGEDPFLGSRIAEAMVRGYQGTDLSSDTTLLACFKHFAIYGASEGGRDYNTCDMSRQAMRNYYLPPYRAAVEAGCGTGMSSFNVVDGLPATGNKWLLDDLLRGEWGFRGFMVSDAGSVGEMEVHGVGDAARVAELGLNAGLDMDMGSGRYLFQTIRLVKEGKVSMKTIDRCVRRILEAKYRLGLFEDPYRYVDLVNNPERQADILCDAHTDFARRFAAECIVLLKNEGEVLPLKSTLRKVAVVGPIGREPGQLFGTWSTRPDGRKSHSVADALRQALAPACEVNYYQGCTDAITYPDFYQTDSAPADDPLLSAAVAGVADADVVIATVGETPRWTGEAQSRVDINLPIAQKRLLRALEATGKPVVVVVFGGRPLVLTDEARHFPALVEAWHGGTQAADALADVLTGRVCPSGKTSITFPRYAGQVPIYYNHLPTGRPLGEFWATSKYVDISLQDNYPLFPFGYGLSYNTYAYSNLRASKTQLRGEDDVLEVSVDVRCEGRFEGQEVVQLYVTDPVARISRPVKELKDFQKVSMHPGETRTVTFRLTTDALKYYDNEEQYGWDGGQFIVGVGPDSGHTQQLTVQWDK